MKIEVFDSLLNSLNIKKENWVRFSEIASIRMKNGEIIKPSWEENRFFISEKGKIFIRNGVSVPYGGLLKNPMSIPYDFSSLLFPPSETIIAPSKYPKMREPVVGDVILAVREKVVLEQSFISEILKYGNGIRVKLLLPFKNLFNEHNYNFVFYDSKQYEKNQKCMHSEEENNVFMKFVESETKHKYKEIKYNKVIKIKNIEEITLKVTSSSDFGKTFSVK